MEKDAALAAAKAEVALLCSLDGMQGISVYTGWCCQTVFWLAPQTRRHSNEAWLIHVLVVDLASTTCIQLRQSQQIMQTIYTVNWPFFTQQLACGRVALNYVFTTAVHGDRQTGWCMAMKTAPNKSECSDRCSSTHWAAARFPCPE